MQNNEASDDARPEITDFNLTIEEEKKAEQNANILQQVQIDPDHRPQSGLNPFLNDSQPRAVN